MKTLELLHDKWRFLWTQVVTSTCEDKSALLKLDNKLRFLSSQSAYGVGRSLETLAVVCLGPFILFSGLANSYGCLKMPTTLLHRLAPTVHMGPPSAVRFQCEHFGERTEDVLSYPCLLVLGPRAYSSTSL